MKKFIKLVVAAATILAVSTSAMATGAITPKAQEIIDQVAVVGALIGDTQITAQARAIIETKELTNEDADKILALISEALVLADGYDRATLPYDTAAEIKGKVLAAASILGLSLTLEASGTVGVVDNETGTTTTVTPVKPVKKTGADYTMSLVALAAMASVVVGAVVVGKKSQRV